MSANTRQVGGDHYASEYQHWDFVRVALAGRYLEGQITKYVARWRKKNGVQDIDKARHYLDKLAETFANGAGFVGLGTGAEPQWRSFRANEVQKFCAVNGLGHVEAELFSILVAWESERSLTAVSMLLASLRADAVELAEHVATDGAIAAGEVPGHTYINPDHEFGGDTEVSGI